MALLGDDGRGYELARKLENQGVWRSWLGDALYPTFVPFLFSPSAWEAFMRVDESKTKPQIHLQLRVRALLFDKASVSLYTQPAPISNLNPNYLELHGDDVYFTLENGTQDGDQRASSNTSSTKGHSKTSNNSVSRFSESEEFPDTWYYQFFEKYKANKSYKLMFGDKESDRRTPEQMSAYLRVVENHKRRRLAFKDNVPNLHSNSTVGESTSVDDMLLFPETMFTLNCVPDNPVLPTSGLVNNRKVQFNGVLDNLPQITAKSPVISSIMIERLGIRPEYLNMEQGHPNHGKNGYQGNRKPLAQEQALQMAQKVVARLLAQVGFESSSESSLEVLAQFLSSHIGKLGRIIKLLADSYRQQCSATELLKMFLQTAGYSNLAVLAELTKDNTKNVTQQNQQQLMNMQAQFQSQQQASIQQQIFRQMSPQMQQQMSNPQFLAFQQQQQIERMRRQRQQQQQQQQQQQTMPRPGMNMNNMNMNINMDKDRPLVQVKMEAPSDFPINTNSFAAMNSRHPQFRQQQLAAISSLHAQANSNSFRPMSSLQQIQSPNMGMARAPPVKVEGFQELMGGDSSMKHDVEENKLLSPQK